MQAGSFYSFGWLLVINFFICWMRLSSSNEVARSYFTKLSMFSTPRME